LREKRDLDEADREKKQGANSGGSLKHMERNDQLLVTRMMLVAKREC